MRRPSSAKHGAELARIRALCERGATAQAWPLIGRLYRKDPAAPDVAYLYCRIQHDLGRFDATAAILLRLIADGVRHPDVTLEAARALLAVGAPDRALAACDSGVALFPLDGRLHYVRGLALHALRRPEESVAALRQAAAIAEGNDEIRFALAIALVNADRTEEAREELALCRTTRRVAASLVAARLLPTLYRDAAEIGFHRKRYGEELVAAIAATDLGDADAVAQAAIAINEVANFALAYQGEDDRALNAVWGAFATAAVARTGAGSKARSRGPSKGPSSRLAVGFVMGELSDHTSRYLFGDWLHALPAAAFAVSVHYASGAGQPAEHEGVRFERLQGGLADRIAAVAKGAPDVLIFPDIGMASSVTALAAAGIAPAQLASFGHPVTTGLPTMRWFLSAAAVEAPDGDSHYSERLVRLPGLGVRFPRPETIAAVDRGELGVAAGAPLLFCNQTLVKMHPDNLALFARLLRRLPDATLLLIETGPEVSVDRFKRLLGEACAREGAAPGDRLRFLKPMPRPRFLGICAAADVMVDTLHWSGGRSTLEAASQGLLPVTVRGRFFRGRFTAGVLDLLGLPELVAPDPEAYVETVAALVARPTWRAALQAKMRARIGAVLDDRSWAPALAEAVRQAAAAR